VYYNNTFLPFIRQIEGYMSAPRILVIDDEEPIRRLLRKLLEGAGYEVIEAENGRAGIQQCNRATVDLVITDIIMPEGEGLETIRELRRLQPGMKIFAMTGARISKQLDILNIAEAFGAIRTFDKPFELNAVLNAVREQVPLPPA
jgi:DNA-binding NtrC family response regulator